MGCIKFLINQDDITYQIKFDDKGISILDKDGKELDKNTLKDKEKNILHEIESLIQGVRDKIKDDKLLYNYFFNVLNSSHSRKIKKSEDTNGDVTYSIDGSFKELESVFQEINNNLKDIDDVNQDILRHYSASYREKVLGHGETEIIDNSDEQGDILYSINNALLNSIKVSGEINKTFDIWEGDTTKSEPNTKTLLESIQEQFNSSLEKLIVNLDKVTKEGISFDVQLYSNAFALNDNLNYIQTLSELQRSYKTFVNAFNKSVSKPYDLIVNKKVELQLTKKINKNNQVTTQTVKNELSIKDLVTNIYSSVNRIDEDNVKEYQDGIEKLIEAFEQLGIDKLLRSIYSLHDHIKIIENLHDALKSNKHEKDDYLENVSRKELVYVQNTEEPINILENILLKEKVNNESLEILTLLSNLYVSIKSLKTNYEYFKMNKPESNRDLTADELKRIIEISDLRNIKKDITWYNKYLIQFESTNVAQATSLKTLFDLHDKKLKDKNSKDLGDIKEKYNYFLDKFGSYNAMEKAMKDLFERDKTKTVRTGYLISKYDNSELVMKDDAFRTTKMNGKLQDLYNFIKDNTTYGALIDNTDIVPSIFDLLGFQYADGSNVENRFKKRDDVYNEVVLNYSKIKDNGNADKPIANNIFGDNLELKNRDIKLGVYLDRIKKKLDKYYDKLRDIKDSNGNRVISDEYIDFMKMIIDNNHKSLRNYFDVTNKLGERLHSVTYNDIAIIANSYMTILDRFDIGTYFIYMNDTVKDINKSIEKIEKDSKFTDKQKELEIHKIKITKSDFSKIYKLSRALKYNELNYKDTSKTLSDDYKHYLDNNSNMGRDVLDEFYNYFYETFLKLNKDVDNIDMYSRIGNKVFIGEAEKTLDEKVKDGGIWGTFRDEYLSGLVNEKSHVTYKIFDDDPTMIRNISPRKTLTLTEDQMTFNIFLNLINSTIERNKYEMGEELIMNGKSYIMSLSNVVTTSGTNIERPMNLMKKIKEEIETKLGYNRKRLFLNNVPVLKQSGVEKIERKLLSDKEQLINSNINKFYENMMYGVVNEFYNNRMAIYNKLQNYGVRAIADRKSEEKVTHIEFSFFLERLYSEIMNNPVLMEQVKEHNEVLNSIILTIIAKNEFWFKQLREAFNRVSRNEKNKNEYLNGVDTNNIKDDTDFLHFITHDVKTLDFIFIYIAILGRGDLYNENSTFNEPLKKLSWQEVKEYYEGIYKNISQKAKLTLNRTEGIDTVELLNTNNKEFNKSKFKEIIEEIDENNKNKPDDDTVEYNLYATEITMGDLDRILKTMFKVKNTDVIQTKKLITQEIDRTETSAKVFSMERLLDNLTAQTASTVLSWNLTSFVAELAYSTIGFFNLGLSSNHFSLVQVLKSMFRSYSYTMKSSMYADKKMEKIKQILSSGEMMQKIGYDHPYYKDMEFNNNVDVWLKRYNDFRNLLGHIPTSLHKNTALYLACEQIYVDVMENGKSKRINILDCFDDNGEMIYPVNDYVISRLMSMYTEVLKQNTLYNNGNVELNKTIFRHLALFKSFLFNMFDNYFHNDTYSRAFDEYHRGIYQSLFGKGSLFISNEGRFSLFRTIGLLPSIITGDASELKYKSDINNIRRFGVHILTLIAIYLAIQTLADDIYEEEEYGFYDEDGNYVKGKRRKRLKGVDKTTKYLYSLLTRVYRENMLMYDANSTISLFGDLGIPQVGYLANMYEFVSHTLTGEVYTTGVYKGESKAKIDAMQMFPFTRAILGLETLGDKGNMSY
jgi:hypothetical protein